MNEYPLISVVVPVYKVEAYLDTCVASIAGQTYPNLEILLVEDGSPDNSGVICDVWAEKDSRVKVIHQKNGGGGLARNRALDIARGELIAFVDSDDYIAPDMFAHLYTLLQQGADIAECGYVETTDDDAEFGGDPEGVFYDPEEALRENIRDTIFRQLIWNKLYRREMIGNIRFPVGTKIDDEYFTYQVLGNTKRLIRSEKVCYAYRQQPNSVMHQSFSLKQLNGLYAKQQRLEYLKERMPQLEAEARYELYFSCIFAMQGCLKALKGEELREARKIIHGIAKPLQPVAPVPEASGLRKLLLRLSDVHFDGTCRLLNFLITIHILT